MNNMEHYRFCESLLNDFKNKKLGYSEFIEREQAYWQDSIETAYEEGFTKGCKKTGTYEQGRQEALKEILPKKAISLITNELQEEFDSGWNACRQEIIDKIKLQK